MKDELDLETTATTDDADVYSFRYLDEETIQLLLDDKIATGG